MRLMTLMRLFTPSRMLVFIGKRAEASMPRRYFFSRLANRMAGVSPLSMARRYHSRHRRAPSGTLGANQISFNAVLSR